MEWKPTVLKSYFDNIPNFASQNILIAYIYNNFVNLRKTNAFYWIIQMEFEPASSRTLPC